MDVNKAIEQGKIKPKQYQKNIETEEEKLLRNLLATIYRDGGHYVSNNGLKKATQDAIDLIIEERCDVEKRKLSALIDC